MPPFWSTFRTLPGRQSVVEVTNNGPFSNYSGTNLSEIIPQGLLPSTIYCLKEPWSPIVPSHFHMNELRLAPFNSHTPIICVP